MKSKRVNKVLYYIYSCLFIIATIGWGYGIFNSFIYGIDFTIRVMIFCFPLFPLLK